MEKAQKTVVNQWATDGTPMEHHCQTDGKLIDNRGKPMEYHGKPMDTKWTINGARMEKQWNTIVACTNANTMCELVCMDAMLMHCMHIKILTRAGRHIIVQLLEDGQQPGLLFTQWFPG